MWPFLFDITIGSFHLKPPTYGVMLALAFSVAYFESLRCARKLGEELKHIENLFLIIVAGSIFGGRAFHVLFEDFSYYRAHPSKIIAVWEGGYTLYGALIVSILGIMGYSFIKKLNCRQFCDIASIGTALGIFIGRIGCFAAGCCWGKSTDSFMGVMFSHPETFAAVRGLKVHPTQLYESFGALLIAIYLYWRFRKRAYKGQIMFHGLVLYAILRFGIEFFRGDEYRGYLFGHLISYSQFVSILILAFAGVCIARYRKLADGA